MENVIINIDSDVKNKAQSVFGARGLDISTAVNMLLRREIYGEEISLEAPKKRKTPYILEPDTTKTPTLGCWEGLAVIPDAFYEPLDDLKEYML